MTPEQQRKMLEAAAKACGLRKDDSPYNGGGAGNTGFDVLGNLVLDWDDAEVWNPLTSPADCAEMCAELEISTVWMQGFVKCNKWLEADAKVGHNGSTASKESAWLLAATMVAAKTQGYEE